MTMDQSRRAFLKRASALSIAGQATSFVLNLAASGEAAAATASDYKALVCVFFYGGNDYANVRRQNIWRNSWRRLAECGPRQGVDVRRRACGVASADARWSVA